MCGSVYALVTIYFTHVFFFYVPAKMKINFLRSLNNILLLLTLPFEKHLNLICIHRQIGFVKIVIEIVTIIIIKYFKLLLELFSMPLERA